MSAIVLLIGFTPAFALKRSSIEVFESAALMAVRATVAITQPITPTAIAAIRLGIKVSTWFTMLANGAEIEFRFN